MLVRRLFADLIEYFILLFKYVWAHFFYLADHFNFGLFWMLLLLVFMLNLFDSWEEILSSQCDIMRGCSLCFCQCRFVSREKKQVSKTASTHLLQSELTLPGPFQTERCCVSVGFELICMFLLFVLRQYCSFNLWMLNISTIFSGFYLDIYPKYS